MDKIFGRPITKDQRSRIMSKIRGSNTKFEKEVIRALRRRGVWFQTHYKNIIGKPDIALPSQKKAVFLDSDFWHGWQYTRWSNKLTTDFWRNKIENNKKRDKKVTTTLRKKGWKVFRVWEHEFKKDFDKAIDQIEHFLKKLNNL